MTSTVDRSGGAAAMLAAGTAYADLSAWRKLGVTGADAFGWLNDLVSADLAALAPGRAVSSLLLSPTGAVLAAFTVASTDGGIVLVQDRAQARPIGELLAPYVLSSDVRLEDRTEALTVLAFPGLAEPPEVPGATASAPSALGTGVDLFVPAPHRQRVRTALDGFAEAAEGEVEAWRVKAGVPRLAVDGGEGDLPAECGLDAAVSTSKGCFLGQEAVARVRNLGHPRRVLLHFAADRAVEAGEPVLGPDGEVGQITSAAASDGRWFAFAKVRWEARSSPLATVSGTTLEPPP